jgi:hypothetical protein
LFSVSPNRFHRPDAMRHHTSSRGVARIFVKLRGCCRIAASQRHPGDLQNPNAAVECNRNHVATFDIATRRRHPQAIDPYMPRIDERRSRTAGAYDAGIPQPPVDSLPVSRHDKPASAALLGIGLELGLEGRELGKR